LDLADRGGLSMVLREDSCDPEDGMVTPFPTTMPNLQILQAGESANASADLLESNRMNTLIKSCRDRFDTIILDGPPILSATDAVPLSMLSDTTILVARVGQTPRIALRRACTKLQMHKRHCDLRVALNAVKTDSYAFYDYYGTRSPRPSEEEQHASA
jgi:Mrp family chromosome partitioning ATPase